MRQSLDSESEDLCVDHLCYASTYHHLKRPDNPNDPVCFFLSDLLIYRVDLSRALTSEVVGPISSIWSIYLPLRAIYLFFL